MTYAAASDFYQRETIRDLRRHNVTYLIYQNSFFSNAILDIPTSTRLPILMSYVHKNYEPYLTLGDNEIWRAKGAPHR